MKASRKTAQRTRWLAFDAGREERAEVSRKGEEEGTPFRREGEVAKVLAGLGRDAREKFLWR